MILWSDVKSIFESGLDVRGHKTSGVAFEFHRKATLFRTPVEHWIASPFAVGEIDLSPPDVDRLIVTVSRIEAMRVVATAETDSSPDT